MKRQIWIAGAGISGAFAALRLLRLGYRVTIWKGPHSSYKAVESIPGEVLRLLEEMDTADCIVKGGGDCAAEVCCIERSAFAESMLEKAYKAGAQVRTIQEMPIDWAPHCDAFLDATGRAAAWSRPVRRHGREIADLYEISEAQSCPGGQIIATEAFWAYCLATRSAATAAVITRHKGSSPETTREAWRQLNIDPSNVRFICRRFCSPQWAEKPMERQRISIGDAAFAYYPVAGMGIRFTLTTAIAAGTVLHTRWLRPEATGVADDYYHDLCESARASHLVNLIGVHDVPSIADSEPLTFTARKVEVGVQRGDFILPEKTYLLPDGSRVRWIGAVDLALIESLAKAPITGVRLIQKLAQVLPAPSYAKRIVEWCIRHRVLSVDRSCQSKAAAIIGSSQTKDCRGEADLSQKSVY